MNRVSLSADTVLIAPMRPTPISDVMSVVREVLARVVRVVSESVTESPAKTPLRGAAAEITICGIGAVRHGAAATCSVLSCGDAAYAGVSPPTQAMAMTSRETTRAKRVNMMSILYPMDVWESGIARLSFSYAILTANEIRRATGVDPSRPRRLLALAVGSDAAWLRPFPAEQARRIRAQSGVRTARRSDPAWH
jgi:hypothetical protein